MRCTVKIDESPRRLRADAREIKGRTTMNSGTILAVLSLATAAGNLASHYPKIKANQAILRPRREQAVMVLAVLLAVAGLVLHPGIVGYVIGGPALLLALFFLFADKSSDLNPQQPALA